MKTVYHSLFENRANKWHAKLMFVLTTASAEVKAFCAQESQISFNTALSRA